MPMFVRRLQVRSTGGPARRVSIWTSVFIPLIAVSVSFLLTGCPTAVKEAALPEVHDTRSIRILPPPDTCIWPRAGGGFGGLNASRLEGPRSFRLVWEASAGSGEALSPAVDADGNVFAGTLGGYLTGLTAEGKERFVFGKEESGAQAIGLRAGPALGGGLVWVVSDAGIVAVDFDGKEAWRLEAKYLSEGGALNLAVCPKGGLLVSTRDGSVILFDENGQPEKAIATEGSSVQPACFDEIGDAYLSSSDGNVYRIGPDGNLKWKFPGGDAFIASPAVYRGKMYACSMDGYLYSADESGREKWRCEIIVDPTSIEKKLRQTNADVVVGLIWPPIIYTGGAAGENADGDKPAVEMIVGCADRPDKVSDASYLLTFVKDDGKKKLVKEAGATKSAEAGFGAAPVVDGAGRVYVAYENKVACYLGKDILAEFTIPGTAKVSGAQSVITKDRQILVPMNDGRILCLGEAVASAPPAGAAAPDATGTEQAGAGQAPATP